MKPLAGAAQNAHDSRVRAAAASALGEFKSRESIDALIAAMKSRPVYWQVGTDDWGAAPSALGRIGPLAIDPLIAELRSADLTARKNAIEALGYIEDTRAFDAIIPYVKDDSPVLRTEAVKALHGHGQELPGLMLTEVDFDEALARAGAKELAYKPDPRLAGILIAALKDPDVKVRLAAMDAICELRLYAAADPLLSLLKDPTAGIDPRSSFKDADLALQYGILRALGRLGDSRAFEPFAALLAREGPKALQGIGPELIGLKDPRTVDVLIPLLHSNDVNDVEFSIELLGKLRDPKAVKPLREIVHSSNTFLPLIAVDAIGKIGGNSAVAVLIDELKNPDAAIQAESIRALHAAGYPMDQALTRILENRESTSSVRAAAAWVLGQSQDSALVDALDTAVKDRDKEVRVSAVKGMCLNEALWVEKPLSIAMSDPGFGFPCEPYKTPIIEALATELTASDSSRRARAARTLDAPLLTMAMTARIKDGAESRGIQAMLDALRRRDVAVIDAALPFYISWGEPGSEDVLIDALQHVSEDFQAGFFLVSGHAKLEDAGRTWLTSRRLTVRQSVIGTLWGEIPMAQKRLGAASGKPGD